MQTNLNDEIRKLSVAERIILVEEIWDSIAQDKETFELSQEQQEELDKRARSFSEGRSWNRVKAEYLNSMV